MLSALIGRLRRRNGPDYTEIERAQLNALTRASAQIKNLRGAADIHLSELVNSKSIASDWSEDSAAIDAIETIKDMTTDGVNPGDRRALYHLVRFHKPKSVLEVGTNVGASTMSIAAALKRNGIGALTSVDILDVNAPDGYWMRYGLLMSPRERIAEMGMAERVTFFAMPSLDFLDSSRDTFDMIFLDGDHTAATVYREVPAALDRLNRGGIIVLHDVFPGLQPLWSNGAMLPGPELAASRLTKENPSLTLIPLGELAWPTKLGSNVTSLALLARH